MNIHATVKILIVDDNPANLFSLEKVLKSSEFGIETAPSGNEALAKLLETEYACILLDVNMPEMSGFELAKIIREDDHTKFLPIIFASAHQQGENDIFKGYETGAVDYLLKPLNPVIVRSKVSIFVELFKHRKALERTKEVEELNRHLEKLIKQLDGANKKLLQNKNDLEQFAHAAAHDLREPTRRISLLIDLIIGDFETLLNKEGRQRLVGLKEHVLRLDSLISALQYITDVDGVSLDFGDVNLGPLVNSVLQGFQDEIAKQAIKVNVGPMPRLMGQEILLTQLFKNLISNAIKHGSNGTCIYITHQLFINDKTMIVSVKNTGSTVKESERDKIFLPFKRFSSKEGTGIGLYICKRIVEVHGGAIWPESAENWTEFKIKFPTSSPNPTQSSPFEEQK